MPERVLFPEWRKSNEPTNYPFSQAASLANAAGRVITEGTFLDAAMYPIGAAAGLYVSTVVIDFQTVTVTVATPTQPALATAAFSLVSPPDDVVFFDAYGRPAGVLVSEGRRLGLFQSWGVGTHEFQADETEFAASCVFPAPEVGVRGLRLETGELFVGDVWLVGADGVVLRATEAVEPVAGTGDVRTVSQVRVDVVGDPLFRRRLCQPRSLFETPRFVQTVEVIGPNMTFTCGPDAAGDLHLTAVNDLATDTVLRIRPTENGLEIAAAGSPMAGTGGGDGGKYIAASPGGGLTGTFPPEA